MEYNNGQCRRENARDRSEENCNEYKYYSCRRVPKIKKQKPLPFFRLLTRSQVLPITGVRCILLGAVI